MIAADASTWVAFFQGDRGIPLITRDRDLTAFAFAAALDILAWSSTGPKS